MNESTHDRFSTQKSSYIKNLKDCNDTFVDRDKVKLLEEGLYDLLDKYEDVIEDLENQIETLEENEQQSLSGFYLEGEHDNIVTRSAIELLFENIADIPVDKLEKFINQFKK